MPSGVTASPASISVAPATPFTVTLTASSSAQATSSPATVVFTGTAGSLTHTANVAVSVTANGGGGGIGNSNSRSTYVRSDAVTEFFGSLNAHWAVFNKPTSNFFSADPYSNQIFVYSSATRTTVGAITVPGVFGIDQTSDGSTIWAGTLLGDVYAIDPVKMAVKQRYKASEIGPYGYSSLSTLVMSDGRLALLGEQGGIPSVDGSTSIAIWNPSTNAITIYGGSGSTSIPSSPYCTTMGNIGGFTLSADRSAILIGSIDSDGTVCEIDAATGNLQSTQVAEFGSSHIIVSPDGKYFLFNGTAYNTVALYDAKTFTLVSQFGVNGEIGSDTNAIFSPDSQTFYISDDQFVYAYSVATQQQIGWTPNIEVEPTSGGGVVGRARDSQFFRVRRHRPLGRPTRGGLRLYRRRRDANGQSRHRF